eukprot:TRINITY_DN26871_c0_g1_i1.p2 TRINITY_DN26871_c0_g1~~TRINITY_DN26871_c0_g1_i1.p2  ORF type:complete len:271 (-),score=73.22 TRINITY_DN26871_c0_g1_i1:473-1285(-)
MTLACNGRLLKDADTLNTAGVKRGSSLWVTTSTYTALEAAPAANGRKRPRRNEAFVQLEDGSEFAVLVTNDTDWMRVIKEQIHAKTALPVEDQILLAGGVPLQLSPQPGTRLTLGKPPRYIHIEDANRFLSYSVRPTDTIDSLIRKHTQEDGFRLKLPVDAGLLDRRRTLADANLPDECCLVLAPEATVTVKTLTGKSISVPFRETTTTNDVKLFIAQQEGLPVNVQRLIFASRQLANDELLSDCGVRDNDTMHLVLRLGNAPLCGWCSG